MKKIRTAFLSMALGLVLTSAHALSQEWTPIGEIAPDDLALQLTQGTVIAGGVCVFAWSADFGGYRPCGGRFSVVSSQMATQPYFLFGVEKDLSPWIFLARAGSKSERDGSIVWRLEPLTSFDIASIRSGFGSKGKAPSTHADGECSVSKGAFVRCVTWNDLERKSISQEIMFKVQSINTPALKKK